MLEELETIFNNEGIVKFRIYGVEYTIEKIGNIVVIYQSLNKQRLREYSSIDEVFNKHCIYGELIRDNQKYIKLLEIEKEQLR